MKLLELFKSAYDFTYHSEVADGWVEAVFYDERKRHTSVHLNKKHNLARGDFWVVEFYRDGYGVTGGGDAPRIFSTVMQILRKFVSEVDPKMLKFSAKEESRRKLYDSLVKRFAASYSLETTDNVTDGRVYFLTKK